MWTVDAQTDLIRSSHPSQTPHHQVPILKNNCTDDIRPSLQLHKRLVLSLHQMSISTALAAFSLPITSTRRNSVCFIIPYSFYFYRTTFTFLVFCLCLAGDVTSRFRCYVSLTEGYEGYVQGMSDLCAPIYVVMGADEGLTFWCFVEVMNRMKKNFLRDQSGMKKQLSTLQQLIEMMDPELYRHLGKHGSTL